jgi:hypothetical protein
VIHLIKSILSSCRSDLVARAAVSSSFSASVMPSACAREKPRASSFGVDHQCMHIWSVYHFSLSLQEIGSDLGGVC